MATFGVPSWRDEDKDEDLLGTGAIGGTTTTGGNAASAFGTQEVPNFAPAAPAAPTAAADDQFDLSKTELFRAASKTALDQLQGNVPGWTEQAGEARDAFNAAQAQNEASVRDQLLGLGLRDSGTWAQEGIVRPEQEQLAQRNEFERGLIADRAQLAREQQTAGNTAIANLMGLQQTGEIAQAQLGQDTWKTLRAEELTKAGWTEEAAQAQIQREFEGLQADMDRTLQREVEAGRMTLEQAKLAETVRQFDTEDAWNRYALSQNLSMEQAKLAWQTNERIATQAFQMQESTLDRQLQREVEAGRLTLEQTKLAQQAAQFATELEWQKEATRLGLEMDEAKMVWQASESALDRAHDAQMQLIAQEFELKGMNLAAVLQYVQDMDPTQAADIINNLAIEAGLTYTDDEGNEVQGIRPVVPPAAGTGAPGTLRAVDTTTLVDIARAGGFIGMDTFDVTPEMLSRMETSFTSAVNKLEAGSSLTANEAAMVAKAGAAGVDVGVPVVQSLFTGNITARVGEGESGWQRWTLTPEAVSWATENTGSLFVTPGGKVYEVVGSWNPPNDSDHRNDAGYLIFKDAETGVTYNLSNGFQTTPRTGDGFVPVLPGMNPATYSEVPEREVEPR
jgi:hypothetical protein